MLCTLKTAKPVCVQAPFLNALQLPGWFLAPFLMLSQRYRQVPLASQLPRHENGNSSGIQSLQRGTELKYIELF